MNKLADFSLINLAWNPTNVWKPREATFSLCHPSSSRSFLQWKLLIHLKMGQTRTNHKKQKLDPPFQVHGKKAYKVGGFGRSGIFQPLVIFAAEVEKAPVRVRKWRELLNKLQKNATLNASFLCKKKQKVCRQRFFALVTQTFAADVCSVTLQREGNAQRRMSNIYEQGSNWADGLDIFWWIRKYILNNWRSDKTDTCLFLCEPRFAHKMTEYGLIGLRDSV